MPRSRSTFIQSLRARRRSPRALTAPASWIAPPNSRSFSVSVVLPASGCAMIANVRRFAIAAGSSADDMDGAIYGTDPNGATCPSGSLELQAAVGARALDEGRRGAARGARQLLPDHLELDGCEALALDGRPPVTVQQVGERGH